MKFVITIMFIAILTVIFYPNTKINDDNEHSTKSSAQELNDINTTPIPNNTLPNATKGQPEVAVAKSVNAVEEESQAPEQKSLLEKYFDGDIQFERVNSGDLFDYLLPLWDGTSATINDPIYDITVVQESGLGAAINIEIMKKTTQEEIDDFRLFHTTKKVDSFRASSEYGEDNPTMENNIHAIANNVEGGSITLDALSCKQLKCILYAEGSSEQSFDAFTDGLSKLEDYFLTILHPGDPKQALIYITQK